MQTPFLSRNECDIARPRKKPAASDMATCSPYFMSPISPAPTAGYGAEPPPFSYQHAAPKPVSHKSCAHSASVVAQVNSATRSSIATEKVYKCKTAVRQKQEDVLVCFDSAERVVHAHRSKLFEFIVVADRLERAWLNSAVSSDVYEVKCRELISKFTAARKAFAAEIPDFDSFASELRLNTDRHYTIGYHRLVLSGLPATYLGAVGTSSRDRDSARVAARITAGFITLLDAIDLDQKTPEALLPLVHDLQINLNRLDDLQGRFQFLLQIEEWSRKLHGMFNVANLTPEEMKAFKLQVDLGYVGFQHHLDS